VGQSPSLADVLKMVHPKPGTPVREAFYGYMLGRPFEANALPKLVMQFEGFKNGGAEATPDLPFTMLSALPLTQAQWQDIARNATWQTTRMNLNTFARHGVFEEVDVTSMIAERLRDPREVARAKVFPYQLLAALKTCVEVVPEVVKEALHEAMELSVASVPVLDGPVVVCPDVSGSMLSPVTGYRPGATTSVQCIDVAGLVAAAVVRRNLCAMVLPFAEEVRAFDADPQQSIATIAGKLAALGGGGTNCSAPLHLLNKRKVKADLVIFVSDNQSWADPRMGLSTAMMHEWAAFRQRNPRARLVCLDIAPYATTQAAEREDILNIGGFSDSVFDVIHAFATGELEAGHWVSRIEAVQL
jgi:60 kDa SS-A/Ro ribonucleoprotein